MGVLTPVQQSQYYTPVFIISKKEGTVRFITDYRRINQQLVRNTYPLPRICENMQQLEGFQYATSLDLNIGYYTMLRSNDVVYWKPSSCCIVSTILGTG